MKIICATSIPYAKEAFAPLGELQILDPKQITPKILKDADVLVTRSTLKVGAELLEGTGVKFVGTCTIGYDHLDLDYLEKRKIVWTASPGCNANSVAEYVTAALLHVASKHNITLRGKNIGIIGVGHVGSLVVKKASALGMRILLNDPPLFDLTGDDRYRSLDEVLAESDVVTVHVPLERGGEYPTFHLAGRNFFGRAKKGCIFINAARGAVMNSDDFLKARAGGAIEHAVIDCWENEPAFRPDVMRAADLGTPHIAGYSFEGRSMGTIHVYRELCKFMGLEPNLTLDALLPPPPVPEIHFDAEGKSDEESLAEIVGRVYDIAADDRDLRSFTTANEETRGKEFEKMRKNYHMRREFRYTRVILRNASATLAESLRNLEFSF